MKEKSFEETLERLGQIVSAMESGNLSLEDSLKQYEEGIKCARFCKEKLERAEKKVELLVKQADGTVSFEPFETDTPAPSVTTPKLKQEDTTVTETSASPIDIIDNQQNIAGQDTICETHDTEDNNVETDATVESEKSVKKKKNGLNRPETVKFEKSDSCDDLLF